MNFIAISVLVFQVNLSKKIICQFFIKFLMADASRLATSLPNPAKFSNNYGKIFENV